MSRWNTSRSWFWEEAPFFRLLIPLIVAIACYDRGILPAIEGWHYLWVLAPLAILIATSSAGYRPNRVSPFRFVGYVSLVFIAGWICCSQYDIRNDIQWYGHTAEKTEAFSVTVLEHPKETEKTWKLKVGVTSAIRNDNVLTTAGEAFVYIYKSDRKPQIALGDELLLPNRWTAITNPGNPYEFDYATFCKRSNIFHSMFLSEQGLKVVRENKTASSLARRTHDWGMNVLASYVRDTAALGLMQAMLLGDEVNFSDELRTTYADTGIIHIVAISGSHVAIFFFLTTGLLFWISKRKEYLKYLLAIPLIWFYVVVAGSPSSAVRAGVMFTLLGVGLAFRRGQNPLNILFASAFLMLLVNPMWLFAIGFQLSFIAVLSLILFYQRIYLLVYVKNYFLKKLWQTAAASIAAEILVAPLVLYYFHLLPATFLVANVFAYVFMSVLLIMGLVLVAVGMVPAIAGPVGFLISTIIRSFNNLIEYLQDLNPVALSHIYLPFHEMALVYVMIAGLAVYLLRKLTGGLITALACLCILLVSNLATKVKTLQTEDLVVYNISGVNYIEKLTGEKYIPLTATAGLTEKKRNYATREMHVTSGAWKARRQQDTEVLTVDGRKILILNHPLTSFDSSAPSFDYVVINYPMKTFEGSALLKTFNPKQLIFGSNQKRYHAQRWKDSCAKNQIPAHFTHSDGAFLLSRN